MFESIPEATAVTVGPLSGALADLHRAIERVRDAIEAATGDETVELARAADRLTGLTAAALESSDGLERSSGMPERMALSNRARLNHQDARALLAVRSALAHMPLFRASMTSGRVSFSQARQIARGPDPAGRPARAPRRLHRRARADGLALRT